MKKTLLYTDKSIIDGLKRKNNQTIEHIYKGYFPSIEKFVLKNNGNNVDAEDVFQDALVIFYKKIVYEQLELTCSVKTYIYAICKNLWLQRLRKKKKGVDAETEADIVAPFELSSSELEQKKYNMYKKHFLKLSEGCQKILTLFLRKTPLKEIAVIMKHSSTDYTKTRKYLCKKELKRNIYNDPEYKNL